MSNTSRFPRRARGLLLLGICLLLLGAVPTNPTRAALLPQMVDNSLQDFTRGTFQRTSLSSLRNTTASPADLTGAVQLVPVGILKDWFNSPFLLPEKLTDIGAVAIGPHIFVIGGTATVGTAPAPSAHVWSVTIDPTTGAPMGSNWTAEPDLPAVRTSDTYITPVAGRAVPAVAAVQTGPDAGYIYVIGGNVRPTGSPDSVSSYAVSIGTVSGGRITGWSADNAALRIPATDILFGQLGLQSASALSFTTGGQTYIYIIGGLQRYREGIGAGQHTVETGSSQVFYAKVGGGGQLLNPSTNAAGWGTTAAIPVPTDIGDSVGLWDGAAAADHFDVGGGIGGDVLYMMGGQLRSNLASSGGSAVYNNAVYRALINSNGTFAWQADNPQLTLPEARVGHAAVQFNGNIYVTGGRPVGGTPGQPQAAVLTSYIQDDLKLAQIGENSNFIRNSSVLGLPRARHASVVVPATPTDDAPNAAYVYVIAGQGDPTLPPTDDDQGSNTMIYGKIGKSEDTRLTGYATSGWYYSTPYNTIWNGAQVQEIRWTTTITPPSMDIKMQYRISTASDCNSSSAFTSSPWQDIDGSPTDSFFSKNGANVQNLGTGLVAHCFQYRAYLTSSGGPPTQSPALLNVSILIFVPGGPDLKVKSINDLRSPTGNNALTGLTVTLLNQNTFQQTLPADAETSGSFFVDLFVFREGQTVITPTVPLSDGDKTRSKGYANVNKSTMGVNIEYTVKQWCDPSPTVRGCRSIDLLSTAFSQPGKYTVMAVVDSYNYVPETPSAAEQNNITTKIITVPSTLHNLFMPMIRK